MLQHRIFDQIGEIQIEIQMELNVRNLDRSEQWEFGMWILGWKNLGLVEMAIWRMDTYEEVLVIYREIFLHFLIFLFLFFVFGFWGGFGFSFGSGRFQNMAESSAVQTAYKELTHGAHAFVV